MCAIAASPRCVLGFGDDNVLAVATGVIFNTQQRDHTLATVVAMHYSRFGAPFLRDIDGTYALLIFDHRHVLIACDPTGVTPLYWVRGDRTLWVGTDAAVLRGPGRTVERFPPGHFTRGDPLDLPPTASFEERQTIPGGLLPCCAAARYRHAQQALYRVLHKQLLGAEEGGGKVGFLLNGSLGSVAVAAFGKILLGVPLGIAALRTYTVALPTAGNDHSTRAAAFASQLRSRHEDIAISDDAVIAAHASGGADALSRLPLCVLGAVFLDEGITTVVTGIGAPPCDRAVAGATAADAAALLSPYGISCRHPFLDAGCTEMLDAINFDRALCRRLVDDITSS